MPENLTIDETVLKVGRYRHYKGLFYQVLAIAKHSETREWVVVYRCLYGDCSIWVRPLEMFVENVILETGQSVIRFVYIEEMDGDLLIGPV